LPVSGSTSISTHIVAKVTPHRTSAIERCPPGDGSAGARQSARKLLERQWRGDARRAEDSPLELDLLGFFLPELRRPFLQLPQGVVRRPMEGQFRGHRVKLMVAVESLPPRGEGDG
jgi:hypothetical protein